MLPLEPAGGREIKFKFWRQNSLAALALSPHLIAPKKGLQLAMSTVSKFVQLLEDIGYSAGPATAAKPPPGRPSSVKARALGQQTSQSSGNKTISADSLEWMFLSEDSTKPFLQWFCSNITKRNFVSADQLERYALVILCTFCLSLTQRLRYEALRDQLRTIDSPTDLQAALKQAGKTKSNDVELDELKYVVLMQFSNERQDLKLKCHRAEIASLEHQLSTSKDELKELVWQRDIMQNQLRAAQRRTEDVRSLIKLRDNEFGVTHLPRLDQANQRVSFYSTMHSTLIKELVLYFS